MFHFTLPISHVVPFDSLFHSIPVTSQPVQFGAVVSTLFHFAVAVSNLVPFDRAASNSAPLGGVVLSLSAVITTLHSDHLRREQQAASRPLTKLRVTKTTANSRRHNRARPYSVRTVNLTGTSKCRAINQRNLALSRALSAERPREQINLSRLLIARCRVCSVDKRVMGRVRTDHDLFCFSLTS